MIFDKKEILCKIEKLDFYYIEELQEIDGVYKKKYAKDAYYEKGKILMHGDRVSFASKHSDHFEVIYFKDILLDF